MLLVHVAPEILRAEEYTCAVDIWSLGVILYVMLIGEYPFLLESERLDEKAQFKRTMDR